MASTSGCAVGVMGSCLSFCCERLFGVPEDAQSREQLSEVIQKWSAAMSIESFFREAEERLAGVETDRRQALSSRLDLARSMMGTLDPLEFLELWVAPDERYTRQYPED